MAGCAHGDNVSSNIITLMTLPFLTQVSVQHIFSCRLSSLAETIRNFPMSIYLSQVRKAAEVFITLVANWEDNGHGANISKRTYRFSPGFVSGCK